MQYVRGPVDSIVSVYICTSLLLCGSFLLRQYFVRTDVSSSASKPCDRAAGCAPVGRKVNTG